MGKVLHPSAGLFSLVGGTEDVGLPSRMVVSAPAGSTQFRYNPAYARSVIATASLIMRAFKDLTRLPDLQEGASMDPRATSQGAESYVLESIYTTLISVYPEFAAHVASESVAVKQEIRRAKTGYRDIAALWLGPIAHGLCLDLGWRLLVHYGRNHTEAEYYGPLADYCAAQKCLRELPYTVRIEYTGRLSSDRTVCSVFSGVGVRFLEVAQVRKATASTGIIPHVGAGAMNK